MKKHIFLFVLILVGGVVFASCTNTLTAEETQTNYKQVLTYDDQNKQLSGYEEVGFYNYTNQTLNEIKFHLYANAFREGAKANVVSLANTPKAFPNGKSYGDIKIQEVKHKNNTLNYSICGEDKNILSVTLSEPLLPESKYSITINFKVSLANINHRLGYGNNTINLCNYYPIVCYFENGDFITDLYNSNGDPFYSKISNYEVQLTYPQSLTLASTGQILTQNGEKKVSTIKAKNVRDFAMVLSDKFQVISDVHDGITVNYYYYNDENSKKTLLTIIRILDFNKEFAGKYPYKEYSVVKANFVHGGMEYPQIVLISDDLDSYDTYLNVVIHETCHQWWYGVVGSNQYNYGWLDEGLTDYNTAIFYDEFSEYGLKTKDIMSNANKSYKTFVDVYSKIYEKLDTSMNRRLDEFKTEYEYVYCTYTKGMLLFDSLNEFMGQAKFKKAIKYYYNNNKFSETSPEILIKDFEKCSHRKVGPYIKSWTNGDMVMVS